MQNRLEFIDCCAGYGTKTVFENINLSFGAGETVALLGPSGCGKSTLLKLAAGIIRPFSGRVLVDGEPAAAADRRVGLILQNYGLFPWLTVYENIALGLKIRGGYKTKTGRSSSDDAVREIMKDLTLEGESDSYPGQLSGGQQQRVAIGRTLVLEPEVLLMDEPFSALDAISRERLQELLLSMLEGRNIITLLVTHSVEEAAFLGSRVLLIGGASSRITGDYANGNSGTAAYRADKRYFELCGTIRRELRADDC